MSITALFFLIVTPGEYTRLHTDPGFSDSTKLKYLLFMVFFEMLLTNVRLAAELITVKV